MSIRARLTVWYGLAFVAIIAVAGVLVWIQVRRDLESSLADELRVHAIDLRTALETDPQAVIDIRDPNRPGVFTVVQDTEGRAVRSTANAPSLPPALPLGASESAANGDTWALYTVETVDGRRVISGATLAELDRATRSLTGGLLVVGSIAGLVALAGGWWLAGHALAPVTDLVGELETIDVDDLGRRVTQPPSTDELGRLGRAINAMLGRIDDGMQRQQAFVAAASHDLRTPLAALRTELELAERGPAEPDALLGAIRAAHGDALRLGHLANDVLALAEAEPGGRPLSREPVNVFGLLTLVSRDFQAEAGRRSVHLLVEAPPQDVANVDRSRIEQAVRNLLQNAMRYSPSGSAVRITGRVAPGPAAGGHLTRPWLEVAVMDRGPGVAAEIRPRLFLPFARSGEQSGSGLGLATAAAAIRAHGGEIGLRDPSGGGAELWFRVPA